MLTQDDLTQLKKPFAASDHEFLNGMAYITEHAITERIETVDPAWSFQVRSIAVRDSAGKGGKDIYTVTVHAALTINGVTRDNVGMASVQKSDLKDETIWNNNTRKKEPTGRQYTIEANEAEKSATTDALKRCARLFAIGRYLLTLPSDVKDEQSMARWLEAQGGTQQTSTPSNVTTLPAQTTVTNGNGNSTSWRQSVMALTAFLYNDADMKYNQFEHTASIQKRMNDTSTMGINPDTHTPEGAATVVLAYRATKDLHLTVTEFPQALGGHSLKLFMAGYDDTGTGLQAAWQALIDHAMKKPKAAANQ